MHRSLPIEAELSSPTKRFSFAGLEFHSGNRPRSRRRPRPRAGCFLPGLVRPAPWRKRLGDGKVPLMSGIFFSSRIRCGLADSESPATHRGDRTNTSGTVSGSRLLPPHRTATRQSGSPPCRGKAAAPGRGNAAPPILQTGFARNDFSLRRPCHP